ncbi:hypothetical protein HGK72_26730 [Mycolicibacterium fortuitum]|uniref:hypothetical protein n=1 Tax=Mycolicibacterium fortuitum TaxID=1766 RepID=UPI00149052E3|nr:hypothetical protein [Mycolicibacterium fortuitum]
MSVTFNRAQLVKVAKTALTAHDKAQVEYLAERENLQARHAADWNRQRLINFRDWLTKKLKTGGPVEAPGYDVTDGANLTGLFYSPMSDYQLDRGQKRPKGLLTAAEAIEIRALLKVLEAASGDTVSVNELKLLGLKNLQPVFTAAAQEAGK